MRARRPIWKRSYHRAGRLVPQRASGLRAGSVTLRPGETMDWHSTRDREELVVALVGKISLEVQGAPERRSQLTLAAGTCAWLPPKTLHRVVNCAPQPARYLYITAPREEPCGAPRAQPLPAPPARQAGRPPRLSRPASLGARSHRHESGDRTVPIC